MRSFRSKRREKHGEIKKNHQISEKPVKTMRIFTEDLNFNA